MRYLFGSEFVIKGNTPTGRHRFERTLKYVYGIVELKRAFERLSFEQRATLSA